MVDPESVRRRLREIDRRLAALRTIERKGKAAFLASEALRAQAERHLQLVIQSAIDIAVHIVAEDSPETPEDYGSTFGVLGEMGVVDADLAQWMRSAAGLRNILVHAYMDVDAERVWGHVQHLASFVDFAASVDGYLTR